jgi:hypothetical protein
MPGSVRERCESPAAAWTPSAIRQSRIDNPPLPQRRRFLPDSERVPRWVPAAGPIRAGLTSQPIRASPALGYPTNLVFQSKNSGYRSCKR